MQKIFVTKYSQIYLLLAWTWKWFSDLIVLGLWFLEGLKKLSREMNKQSQELQPTRKRETKRNQF